MYKKSISEIYPQLTSEQQQVVRQLLVKRFSHDITKWLRTTTGQTGPAAVL